MGIVTINGKRWRLVYVPMRSYDGQCDQPNCPGKEIRIARRLRKFPVARTEALIHEALHAADWSKDEAWVEQIASDITRLLDKEGCLRKDM